MLLTNVQSDAWHGLRSLSRKESTTRNPRASVLSDYFPTETWIRFTRQLWLMKSAEELLRSSEAANALTASEVAPAAKPYAPAHKRRGQNKEANARETDARYHRSNEHNRGLKAFERLVTNGKLAIIAGLRKLLQCQLRC